MKVSELQGVALDWAVFDIEFGAVGFEFSRSYSPSTNWSDGGPIIEREGINLERIIDGWRASSDHLAQDLIAPTPLIAAMRCYVASKLGDEVEVPEEWRA